MNQGHLLKNSLIVLFLLPVPSWKEGGRNLRYNGSIGACGLLFSNLRSLREIFERTGADQKNETKLMS